MKYKIFSLFLGILFLFILLPSLVSADVRNLGGGLYYDNTTGRYSDNPDGGMCASDQLCKVRPTDPLCERVNTNCSTDYYEYQDIQRNRIETDFLAGIIRQGGTPEDVGTCSDYFGVRFADAEQCSRRAQLQGRALGWDITCETKTIQSPAGIHYQNICTTTTSRCPLNTIKSDARALTAGGIGMGGWHLLDENIGEICEDKTKPPTGAGVNTGFTPDVYGGPVIFTGRPTVPIFASPVGTSVLSSNLFPCSLNGTCVITLECWLHNNCSSDVARTTVSSDVISSENPITSSCSATATCSITPEQTLSGTRYVRMEATKVGWISWKEIEIYDSVGNKLTPTNVTASVGRWQPAGQGADKLIDGTGSPWNAGETARDEDCQGSSGCVFLNRSAFAQIDLGSIKNIGKIKLQQNGDSNTEIIKVFIGASQNGLTKVAEFKAPMRSGEWLEYPYPIQTSTPSVVLLVNGARESTINRGDPIVFSWDVQNAEIVTSSESSVVISGSDLVRRRYSASSYSCPFNPFTYGASPVSNMQVQIPYSSRDPNPLLAQNWSSSVIALAYDCWMGRDFTITLKGKQRYSGKEAQASVVLHIVASDYTPIFDPFIPVTDSIIPSCGLTMTCTILPTITRLTPSSGSIGTSVTITGTRFLPTANTINFAGHNFFQNITSNNGTTLTFTVPSQTWYRCDPVSTLPCPSQQPRPIFPGTAGITVTNINGTSNEVEFSVTSGTPISSF